MTDADRGLAGPVGPPPTTRNPQMTVSVAFEEPTDQDEGAKPQAKVSIEDSSHPYLRISLQYAIIDAHGGFQPVGFTLIQKTGETVPDELVRLGPGMIKDLPLSRWDRLAQAAVSQALLRGERQSVTTAVGALETYRDEVDAPSAAYTAIEPKPPHSPAEARRQRAEELITRLRPDLDPNAGKGAARSWNGLVKLAEAVEEHMDEMLKGSSDPVSAMAIRHGVAPATVRTWLHRARQAGITSDTWRQKREYQLGDPSDRPRP
ncbi:hypothetical protein [Streptomyces cucumeris]|uniref:hypothetical protein n=1 Tax=Streptomyces cucumeris TaxID=2962890 RepID=UPI003D75599E